jgi:hypothetical protein
MDLAVVTGNSHNEKQTFSNCTFSCSRSVATPRHLELIKILCAFIQGEGYNGPLELLTVLASLGAMSLVDVLDVVRRLVVWVQGNLCWWIITRVSGSVSGKLGFGDDGWSGATARIFCRTIR